MKYRTFFIIGLLMMMFSSVDAKIISKKVEYKIGDQSFEGFLAYDDHVKGKVPGVLLFHNWLGISAETESKVIDFAKMGVVAFAGDVYGKGVRPSTPQEAGALAGKYKENRKLLREHALAALDELKKQKNVDSTKIVAGGFCFGGTAALELGRTGADLKGVLSYHGGLSNPVALDAKNIKGKVFVFHGAIDPYVPKEEVDGFLKEMNEAKVDYQFLAFANTVHSFTDRTAGDDISKGAAYNANAEKQSLEITKSFLHTLK
jgi:dienelactone hydrolase